jgi:hypothetical protein
MVKICPLKIENKKRKEKKTTTLVSNPSISTIP